MPSFTGIGPEANKFNKMDLENYVSRSKWQEEEEEEEDVKDNWEDEDEEPPKPVAPAEPKKAAGPVKGTKKAGAKGSDLAGASGGSNNKPLTPQEAREKKLLEEKQQRESDMELTKQMLGMEDKNIALEFPLESKEDFDKFHKNLVRKLWCYNKSPHYYLLLDKLIRDLCVPLEADELKNLSSSLNALFNEKVKVSKAKPKKKGVKGLAIKIERNNLDRMERNDHYDDIDDFM